MHAAGLVAHQGGWDEVLLVVGPMVVVVALLRLLKRRVDRQGAQLAPGVTEPPAPETPAEP